MPAGRSWGIGDIDGEVHGFLATPHKDGEQQQMSPSEGRMPAAPLSASARKLLFQRLGIRKR
jgi:hypothetical protein